MTSPGSQRNEGTVLQRAGSEWTGSPQPPGSRVRALPSGGPLEATLPAPHPPSGRGLGIHLWGARTRSVPLKGRGAHGLRTIMKRLGLSCLMFWPLFGASGAMFDEFFK